MTKQMDHERLWAKRWTRDCEVPDGVYLPGHLEDVYVAASQVVEATAEAQLGALALPTAKWLDRFHRVVCTAAALHDLGKCNSQFQEMLKEGNRQALRHEWVSLLIVEAPGWQEWLLPAVGGNEVDWEIVRWSVAGHHPRYDRSAPPELAEGPMRMRLPLDHADMRKTVDWLEAVFNLDRARRPLLAERMIDLSLGSSDLDDLYQRHYDAEDDYDELPPDLRRFVGAVKDCLVAADVAGSALPRKVADATERSRWIVDVLDAVTLPDASDYRRIAASRLECAPDEVDAKLRDFQKETARQSEDPNKSTRRVTLIKAGCGTGKTLAAYRWGESDCSGRRLYVCYPTTGTATEGFRDYLLDPELSEHVKTNLEHGRRHVDFEHILHADEDRNSEIARIESLDLWRIPIVACTVDTVLGLVQNNRRGMFGWPALAQSGFVFDEIHSYDDKLFDALLHFLATLRGVPILLMTASLPNNRKRAIEQVLADGNESLIEIEGPKDIEQQPRYHLADAAKPDHLISEEIERGGKVLRVCNTVRAAMRAAESLEQAHLNPILYHSRFRYLDRVKQHQRVIDAFKNEDTALAVCTQVAEMSLDLSATLLVTDLAPVPALIQRLGRLNRNATKDDPTRPFVVTDPLGSNGKFSPLPYDADDLETSKQWLSRLCGGGQSQRDLARAWEELQETDTETPRYQSAWLDFGPATPVLELREGSPNMTVVMFSDWDDLKAAEVTLPEVALPMPIPPAKKGGKAFDWRAGEFNGVPVAREDAIKYDPQRGAQWQP